MRATVLYSPGDIRCVAKIEEPKIIEPTDAIIELLGILHLRFGPLAISRPSARQPTRSYGSRILWCRC